MSENLQLQIPRTITQVIFQKIMTAERTVHVFFLQADGGVGKTYLARELGMRFGSPSGYEAAKRENFLWSGIMDLYDPDTNTNPGIEERIIKAFGKQYFQKYQAKRLGYKEYSNGGITGPGLEAVRREVENTFACDLAQVAAETYPILVFDTIERLENSIDPVQSDEEIISDTASTIGWLLYQITSLPHGVILLLGRSSPRLMSVLQQALHDAGQRRGIDVFRLHPEPLEVFDESEIQSFFKNRRKNYPDLQSLLDDELTQLLTEQCGRNPLLLDIALQTLIRTQNPADAIKLIRQSKLNELEGMLISSYQELLSKEDSSAATLLYYLALARNGLFPELLAWLENKDKQYQLLCQKLEEMGSLPFVKVREVSGRQTYFLHDAMYNAYDRVMLKTRITADQTKNILGFYEDKLKKENDPSMRAHWMVESIFYRMRSDPVKGYEWFLQREDEAIRLAHSSQDMQFRNAMQLFLSSASTGNTDQPILSQASPIDQAIVEEMYPSIFDDYRLDSASLWIKRYSIRGNQNAARRIAAATIKFGQRLFNQDPKRYLLPYAEFLLWHAQSIMYGYMIHDALKIYNKALGMIKKNKVDLASQASFQRWRYNLVLGRIFNNIGYTHSIYLGQYRRARQYLRKAIAQFREAGIREEWANSNDNMGRTYAKLGMEFEALQLIENGLDERKKLGRPYRQALSENSLAVARCIFGEYDLALKSAEKALREFRNVGSNRGIGIGFLTRGMIRRNMAENWREQELTAEQAWDFISDAKVDLQEAVGIFNAKVQEPLLQVQAYNELACLYRAKYLLLIHTNAPQVEKEFTLEQAEMNFNQAIDNARKQGYFIEELDALQDLSVIYFRASNVAKTNAILDEIEAKIYEKAPQYKMVCGVKLPPPSEKDTDAFFKILGQVYMLRGALEHSKIIGSDSLPLKTVKSFWINTAKHYVFAIVYFDLFSDDKYVHYQTYTRMHLRFKDCDPVLSREIVEIHIPQWIKDYKLSKDLLSKSFEDVFGIFEH